MRGLYSFTTVNALSPVYEVLPPRRVALAMDTTTKIAFAAGLAAVVIGWTASDVVGLVQMAEESRSLHGKKSTKRSTAEVTLTRARDGHFYAEAEVNGTTLEMLADTGASFVVLGKAAAEDAGLSPDTLDYNGVAQTANGSTKVAVVEIDELRVGSIVRRDVEAMVVPGYKGALLGMSFFNTLSKVSIESDELVLKD